MKQLPILKFLFHSSSSRLAKILEMGELVSKSHMYVAMKTAEEGLRGQNVCSHRDFYVICSQVCPFPALQHSNEPLSPSS